MKPGSICATGISLLLSFSFIASAWAKGKPPQNNGDAASYDILIYPAVGFDGVLGEGADWERNAKGDTVNSHNPDPAFNWMDISYFVSQFVDGMNCFDPTSVSIQASQLRHNTKRGKDLAVAYLWFYGFTANGQSEVNYRLYMNGKFREGYETWPPEVGQTAIMELDYWMMRLEGDVQLVDGSCIGELTNPSSGSFKTIIEVTRTD